MFPSRHSDRNKNYYLDQHVAYTRNKIKNNIKSDVDNNKAVVKCRPLMVRQSCFL